MHTITGNMSQDAIGIIDAIKSINKEKNIFEVYFIPIVIPLFTSLLGFAIAYFAIIHQNKFDKYKNRIDIINEFTLSINEALMSLIGIKENYFDKFRLNKSYQEPIYRSINLPPIIGTFNKLDIKVSSLAFIAPKEQNTIKWQKIPRIQALRDNYNNLLDIWDKRSEEIQKIRGSLFADFGDAYNAEVKYALASMPDYIAVLALTEHAIVLTDSLIIEMNDFLNNFPQLGILITPKYYLKLHNGIIKFSSNDNKKLIRYFDRTLEVDYNELSIYLREDPKRLRDLFMAGYS